MNIITILIWITIALIGAIAIVAVKLHYKGNELEHEEGSILPGTEKITDAISSGSEKISNINSKPQNNAQRSLSPNTPQQHSHNPFSRTSETKTKNDAYIVPEVKENKLDNFEYKSQNQVLINYDNTVKKIEEPIKQSQMDIMTQKDKDTSELKDLFTIDELIKESKRKDSEREKEAQKIKSDEEDPELKEIKESIKNKTPEPLIEEVIAEDAKEESEDKQETIDDLIKESEEVTETKSVASQKDIDEAITTASKETEKEVESISEENDITNTLLSQEKEEIAEPVLKTPNKVDKTKDYKLGASIDDANLFGESSSDDTMDLDYRKDIDKVKNKLSSFKIIQDVKEKLTPETEEIPERTPGNNDEFIRTVNEYDEYEPIFNETYMDIEDGTYEEYHDAKLRQENTRRVFNRAKKTPEPELAKPKTGAIKSKPSRDNIKITIGNGDFVLKRGDEIIFNHDGETYSSQVYAINGDDISVKYRRKNITIKPSDVKKID